jgi:hypothetical protein
VLRQALMEELDNLDGVSTGDLLARREAKYRNVHTVRGRFRLLMRQPRDAPGVER